MTLSPRTEANGPRSDRWRRMGGYRAQDIRLQREVALEVLPEAVAGDPDRLARFARELSCSRRPAEVLHQCTHKVREASRARRGSGA